MAAYSYITQRYATSRMGTEPGAREQPPGDTHGSEPPGVPSGGTRAPG